MVHLLITAAHCDQSNKILTKAPQSIEYPITTPVFKDIFELKIMLIRRFRIAEARTPPGFFDSLSHYRYGDWLISNITERITYSDIMLTPDRPIGYMLLGPQRELVCFIVELKDCSGNTVVNLPSRCYPIKGWDESTCLFKIK